MSSFSGSLIAGEFSKGVVMRKLILILMLTVIIPALVYSSPVAAKYGDTDMMKLMRANRAVDLAKKCNKAFGGYDNFLVLFEKIALDLRKKLGKVDPRLANMFVENNRIEMEQVGRAYWKDYCSARLGEFRGDLR